MKVARGLDVATLIFIVAWKFLFYLKVVGQYPGKNFVISAVVVGKYLSKSSGAMWLKVFLSFHDMIIHFSLNDFISLRHDLIASSICEPDIELSQQRWSAW